MKIGKTDMKKIIFALMFVSTPAFGMFNWFTGDNVHRSPRITDFRYFNIQTPQLPERAETLPVRRDLRVRTDILPVRGLDLTRNNSSAR